VTREHANALVLVVSHELVAGCYQAHERGGGAETDAGMHGDAGVHGDAGSVCLPDGAYMVSVRIESTSPPGCVMPMPMPAILRLPPQASDFAMMCDTPGTVTMPAACDYAIDVGCDMGGGHVALHTTLDTHAPAPTGRVTITITSAGGMCTVVVALGD
jgi:hypothetical protein